MRGIREAKDISEYDNLAASAYLRAKEDYAGFGDQFFACTDFTLWEQCI